MVLIPTLQAPMIPAISHLSVQVYCTQPDREAYARIRKDPDEIAEFLAGTTNPWAHGQCQVISQRMSLRVPNANCYSHNDLGRSRPVSLHKHWVSGTYVNEAADLVLLPVGTSVYGYSLATGVREIALEGLHKERVTQVFPTNTLFNCAKHAVLLHLGWVDIREVCMASAADQSLLPAWRRHCEMWCTCRSCTCQISCV
jgi:hypothetical protein